MINCSYQILKTIQRLQPGAVITPDIFPKSWPRNNVTRTLSRLNNKGVIIRIRRGVYSKPKTTRFGVLKSTTMEILAAEVDQNENKCFGGLFMLNNFGLTTQVPTTIEILNNKSSYVTDLSFIKIRYIRIRPTITKASKPSIQFLQVLKQSKIIPDGDTETTHDWLRLKLENLSSSEIRQLVRLSLTYPARVRAILGNLLSHSRPAESKRLKKTLNTNTIYNIGALAKFLSDCKTWRIKDEATS